MTPTAVTGPSDTAAPSAGPVARLLWVGAGLIAVGLGTLGLFLPVLPTTGFFVFAAWAFSKGSPRLERWVLGLPKVGPMVGDYRAGLGMSRNAKVMANSMMWLAIVISCVFALRDKPFAALGAVALGAMGSLYIVFRVPLRERVLAERAAAAR